MSNSKILFVTYKFNIFGGKLKPNEFRISAPCCIPSQPQLIFLNFLSRWEFYTFPPRKSYRVNPFWFQQDEFYRLRKSCNKPIYAFNSQRIELFHIPVGRYKMQWQKFQFPTGWNSTLGIWRDGADAFVFQFPTGWNSTDQEALQGGNDDCFNSQRDGILRSLKIGFQ